MEQPFLTYSLSFKLATRRKPPELVITLTDEMLVHAEFLLRTSHVVEVSDLIGYLKEDYADPWNEPELNLSPKGQFGIRGCGYVTSKDGISQIRFPYRPETICRVTMTLHVLFKALGWAAEREGVSSNQHQLYSVNTRCEWRDMGWGHSMGGDIFPVFRRWLADITPELRESAEAAMSDAVLNAYVSFVVPEKRQKTKKLWRTACYARINEEGRFYINAPGNACDIAIYPENDFRHEGYIYCQFGCHNLDWPNQQLALLAGFATLCEMARIGMEKQ